MAVVVTPVGATMPEEGEKKGVESEIRRVGREGAEGGVDLKTKESGDYSSSSGSKKTRKKKEKEEDEKIRKKREKIEKEKMITHLLEQKMDEDSSLLVMMLISPPYILHP